MAAHFGRDLVQLQQELHRMKVATKEQVDNIEIAREVNIILNISLFQNTYHLSSFTHPRVVVPNLMAFSSSVQLKRRYF